MIDSIVNDEQIGHSFGNERQYKMTHKPLLKFVVPMIELVWNVDEMLQEHVYYNIHVFADKAQF